MNTLPRLEEEMPPLSAEGSHIALYMEAFTGGGAERVMVNLARGLAARGHRVDMIVVRAEGPYLSLLPPGVRLIDLRCGRSLASLPGLIRYLRRERPVALLSAIEHSNLIALWAGVLARYRGRVVVSVHINLSTVVRNISGFRGRFLLALYRRFYSGAGAVVTVSRDAACDLTKLLRLPPGQVRMIYNPVITPALFEQAKEPVEHPWFEPGQPPVILSVGRLSPQKDFPTLIRAFAQVHQHAPSRLLILGEGPERPALERMVSEMGLCDSVPAAGFRRQPLRLHGAGRDLRPLLRMGGPADRADRGAGLRDAGRLHRLPERPARDSRRRRVRASRPRRRRGRAGTGHQGKPGWR